MQTSKRRLQKEYKQALEQSGPDIKLNLRDEADVMQWVASIKGPPDSPFDGYFFRLSITCPPEYPMVPPAMRFITKCFHPNIHFQVRVASDLYIATTYCYYHDDEQSGDICLDILKAEWSPAWSLQAACRAIIALLAAPAADSPLVRARVHMIMIPQSR